MATLLKLLRNSSLRVVSAIVYWLALLALFLSLPTALRWPARLLWAAVSVWLVWMLVQTLHATKFTGKKLAFMAVLGVFYYFLLAASCHVFIAIMSQRDDRLSFRDMKSLAEDCRKGISGLIDDNKFNKFDKDIGWIPRPNYKTTEYTVNTQGLRGPKEYPLPAPDVNKRILCMGDSFTFGTAVQDDQCYPAQAEKISPGTDWINLGIPGACLVQSFQRYLRDGARFGGKRVVVGFMSNDAQRTVNCFRPFVNADSGCPYTKPFAKYADGKFSVEPNPYSSLEDFKKLLANEPSELRKLQKLDYLTWSGQSGTHNPVVRTFQYVWESYRVDRNLSALLNNTTALTRFIDGFLPVDPYGRTIWKSESAGFKALSLMFEHYHKQIVSDGREPLFVIIPGPLDVDNFVKGFPCQYTSLLDFLAAHNIPHLDFLPTLLAKHKGHLTTEELFVRAHYQPPINTELAAEIIKALKLP